VFVCSVFVLPCNGYFDIVERVGWVTTVFVIVPPHYGFRYYLPAVIETFCWLGVVDRLFVRSGGYWSVGFVLTTGGNGAGPLTYVPLLAHTAVPLLLFACWLTKR
jgi:hypothetical protein